MDVKSLRDIGDVRKYPSMHYIFREGEIGTVMYIVLRGEVEITIDSPRGIVKVARVGPGGFFGEMSLLEGLPRSGSVITLKDSVLLSIRQDRFLEFIRSQPEIVFKIMQSLSGRVRKQNEVMYETRPRCLTRTDLTTVNKLFDDFFS